MRSCRVIDLGLRDYLETHALQKSIVERKRRDADEEDVLLLVEHPEVYTYGRRYKGGELLRFPRAYEVERGGEATYHNPGQLVAYPILTLEGKERDLHLHLRRLEATLIDFLRELGIQGERKAGATGVWTQGMARKIGSLGVAVSGWVTYHGCALNLENDLAGFFRINPCGFDAGVMTSVEAELGHSPGMKVAKARLINCFSNNFGRFVSTDSIADKASVTILR